VTASIEMLEYVARLLDPIIDELVFVGGSVLPLYMSQDPGSEPPRTTDDVDCVIAAMTTREYHAFESRLRAMDFKPCREKGAPMCRWWVGEVKVDFMPQKGEAIGFTNPWYAPGLTRAREINLPSGKRIKIFSLPDFLAAKMAAHKSRGGPDLRISQDFEDVVLVLDAQKDLKSLAADMPKEVHEDLSHAFASAIADPRFEETLNSILDSQNLMPTRKERVRDFMAALKFSL
jgi:predicted nucleotidyltransferase